MWRLVILLLYFIAAVPAEAAIIINEIAWMGSIDSANDEWIELYNSGSDTSVDGWIVSDGGALSLSLAGTIPSGGYAVLERTDDTSAPGSAFLIYTGALGNDGRTLTVRRADNSIEDQVAGGADWNSIGGDNTTKETAQLTTGGWVTGVPTPGATNVTSGNSNNGDEDDTDEEGESNTKTENPTTKSVDDSRSVYISMLVPTNELTLAITAPKTTFVNQSTPLSVTASGISEKLIPSLQYTWNLGNLTTATGSNVSVTYKRPGEYVVIAEGRYGRYEARARHVITVLPTPLSLARDTDGTLLIHNDAQYEVDISGFTLKGKTTWVLPKNTYLAPRASLPIVDVAFSSSYTITLLDKQKQRVAFLNAFAKSSLVVEEESEESKESVAVVDLSPVPQPKISALSISKEETPVVPAAIIPLALATSAPALQMAALPAAGIPSNKLPYLGLIGLIMIGTLAVYTQKRHNGGG